MQDSNRQITSLNRSHAAVAFAAGAASGLLVSGLGVLFVKPLTEFLDQPFAAAPYAFEGKCTKIVNGGTIIVTTIHGNYTVNLVSIKSTSKANSHYAQAVQFTTRLLLNKDVTVQPNRGVVPGEVDAWVYAGPQCFNNEIVKAGYAKYDPGDNRDAPVKALENEARKSKQGLWKDSKFAD